MARIVTSMGAATLRPMLADDELILADLADREEGGEAMAFFQIKGRMTRALKAATQSTEWEGGFGALPAREILTAFVLWNNAMEEEALPPDNGTSSEKPSPPGS